MAGTAGPGHLKTGKRLSGTGFVKRSRLLSVFIPDCPAPRCHKIRVIQRLFRIGCIFGIKIVGMIGKGYKLYIVFFRYIGKIIKTIFDRPGAIRIVCMPMKLSEIRGKSRLAYGKFPVLGKSLFIFPNNRHLHVIIAVFQHLRRKSIGCAVSGCLFKIHRLAGIYGSTICFIESETYRWVISGIRQLVGNLRCFHVSCGFISLRGNRKYLGLVIDKDLHNPALCFETRFIFRFEFYV